MNSKYQSNEVHDERAFPHRIACQVEAYLIDGPRLVAFLLIALRRELFSFVFLFLQDRTKSP